MSTGWKGRQLRRLHDSGRRKSPKLDMINFSWLVEGEVAGSAHPGGFDYSPDSAQGELEVNLGIISQESIGAIVSLSEEPLNQDSVHRFGFRYLHLPVQDMSAPTIDDVKAFIDFAHDVRQGKVGTLVHCLAGMGRTGTMLACYLLHEGRNSLEAMDEVRRCRPGSIETAVQEALGRQYSDLLENSAEHKICPN